MHCSQGEDGDPHEVLERKRAAVTRAAQARDEADASAARTRDEFYAAREDVRRALGELREKRDAEVDVVAARDDVKQAFEELKQRTEVWREFFPAWADFVTLWNERSTHVVSLHA